MEVYLTECKITKFYIFEKTVLKKSLFLFSFKNFHSAGILDRSGKSQYLFQFLTKKFDDRKTQSPVEIEIIKPVIRLTVTLYLISVIVFVFEWLYKIFFRKFRVLSIMRKTIYKWKKWEKWIRWWTVRRTNNPKKMGWQKFWKRNRIL